MSEEPVVTIRRLAPDPALLGRARKASIALGSGPGVDVVVPDPGIAPLHARLEWQHGELWAVAEVYDGRTHRGTRTSLRTGGQLWLGDVLLGVEFGLADEPDPASDPSTLRGRLLAENGSVVLGALKEAEGLAGEVELDALLNVYGTRDAYLAGKAEGILRALVGRRGAALAAGLRLALLHPSRKGRELAAALLESLGHAPQAIDLDQVLGHPEPRLRAVAVDEIRKLADARARPLLDAALCDLDARVVAAALDALAQRGPDPTLTERVRGLLQDPRPRVRLAALRAGASVGAGAALADVIAAIAAHDAEPDLRSKALRVLGGVGGPAAERALASALEDDEAFLREDAVGLAAPSNAHVYRGAVRAGAPRRARLAALAGLARLSAPADLEAILAAAADPDRRVAAAARKGLVAPLRFGAALLAAAAGDRRRPPGERRAVLQALLDQLDQRWGSSDEVALGALFRALADEHPGIRAFVRRRLCATLRASRLEAHDFVRLTHLLDAAVAARAPGTDELLAECAGLASEAEVRQHLLAALARIKGAPGARLQSLVEPVVWGHRLRSPRPEQRRAAAAVHGLFRLPGTVEAVAPLLADSHAWVAGAAARALGETRDARAETPLLNALGRRLGGRWDAARNDAVVTALGVVGGRLSLKWLVPCASYPSAAWALAAVARRAGPEAVGTLCTVLLRIHADSPAATASVVSALDELDVAEAASAVRAALPSLTQIYRQDTLSVAIGMLVRWDDLEAIAPLLGLAESLGRGGEEKQETLTAVDSGLGRLIAAHPAPAVELLERASALPPTTARLVGGDLVHTVTFQFRWADAAARLRLEEASRAPAAPAARAEEAAGPSLHRPIDASDLVGAWVFEGFTSGGERADTPFVSCMLSLAPSGQAVLEASPESGSPFRRAARWQVRHGFLFLDVGGKRRMVGATLWSDSTGQRLELWPDPWIHGAGTPRSQGTRYVRLAKPRAGSSTP